MRDEARVFSWGGNPRRAAAPVCATPIEQHRPRPLAVEEHEHAGMAAAYAAGASHLPFGVLRGYLGTELAEAQPGTVKFVRVSLSPARTSRPSPAHPARRYRSFTRKRPTAKATCGCGAW